MHKSVAAKWSKLGVRDGKANALKSGGNAQTSRVLSVIGVNIFVRKIRFENNITRSVKFRNGTTFTTYNRRVLNKKLSIRYSFKNRITNKRAAIGVLT
jgi:hypothetical protein